MRSLVASFNRCCLTLQYAVKILIVAFFTVPRYFLSRAFCCSNINEKGWLLHGAISQFLAAINHVVGYHNMKMMIVVVAYCNTSLFPSSLPSTAYKKMIVAWKTIHCYTLAICNSLCLAMFKFLLSLTPLQYDVLMKLLSLPAT
jgi:hypothetical protein